MNTFVDFGDPTLPRYSAWICLIANRGKQMKKSENFNHFFQNSCQTGQTQAQKMRFFFWKNHPFFIPNLSPFCTSALQALWSGCQRHCYHMESFLESVEMALAEIVNYVHENAVALQNKPWSKKSNFFVICRRFFTRVYALQVCNDCIQIWSNAKKRVFENALGSWSVGFWITINLSGFLKVTAWWWFELGSWAMVALRPEN